MCANDLRDGSATEASRCTCRRSLHTAATYIKVGFDDNASANHIAYKAKNFIVLCIHSIIMILYNLEVNHTTISGAQNNKGQQNPL